MGTSIKYFIEELPECDASDKMLIAIKEYKSITSEIEKLKMEHFPLQKFNPKRKELGFKIDKLNRKLSGIKEKIHTRSSSEPDKFNSAFRGIANRLLPKRIYNHIMYCADVQFTNPTFELPMLSILSDSDCEIIENAKKVKVENELLRSKIYNARKVISEHIPNLLGQLDTKEYDRRVELQKTLSKINREL